MINKIKNIFSYLWFIIFFLQHYFLSIYKETQLILRIFFLLLISNIFCLFVHAITNGLVKKIETNLYQGYGEIYIQFKKKLFLKEFKNKNIISRMNKIKGIDSFFVYGLAEGALLIDDQYVPISLLTLLFDREDGLFSYQKFNNIKITEKKTLYCGYTLFKKFQHIFHKAQIVILNEHLKKEKCFFYDFMQIKKIDSIVFSWDEWNEKAIIMDIERFENYFELPTIFAINIYLNDLKKKDLVYQKIKKEFNEEIGYITFSKNLLPEYNIYLNTIQYISIFIISLIMIFSLFLLSLLIEIYIINNKYNYLYLNMIGISKKFIFMTVINFFFFINIIASFFGSFLSFFVIKILNKFKIFMINKELNAFLYFELSTFFCFYYIIITLFAGIFFSYYFAKKYIK